MTALDDENRRLKTLVADLNLDKEVLRAVTRKKRVELAQIATPSREKDWLHMTFESWWTMHGARVIMTRLFSYAELSSA